MNSFLHSIELLNNASATGSEKASQVSGRYCFAVAGTFGGATIGLQMLGPDGSTWISIEDTSGALAITAARAVIVELPEGRFRATVTGGAPSGLYASLKRVID